MNRKSFPSSSLVLLSMCLFMLLTACGANKMQYGVLARYRFTKGETRVAISEEYKLLFDRICEVKGMDLGINRVMTGEHGYFISMAFHMVPPDFYEWQEADSTFEILDQKDLATDDMVYRAYLVHKINVYMCRVVFQEPKFDHVIVYDILHAEESEIRSVYDNHEKILLKLNGKKHK